jgi:hypothetical protein
MGGKRIALPALLCDPSCATDGCLPEGQKLESRIRNLEAPILPAAGNDILLGTKPLRRTGCFNWWRGQAGVDYQVILASTF